MGRMSFARGVAAPLGGLDLAADLCGFSPAQRDVWRLAAAGLSAPEIAQTLGITVTAVHQRQNKIRTKLLAVMEAQAASRRQGYRDSARSLGFKADCRGKGRRRRLPTLSRFTASRGGYGGGFIRRV
jgi:DNA-binding CsgD family transcriptional regulator